MSPDTRNIIVFGGKSKSRDLYRLFWEDLTQPAEQWGWWGSHPKEGAWVPEWMDGAESLPYADWTKWTWAKCKLLLCWAVDIGLFVMALSLFWLLKEHSMDHRDTELAQLSLSDLQKMEKNKWLFVLFHILYMSRYCYYNLKNKIYT